MGLWNYTVLFTFWQNLFLLKQSIINEKRNSYQTSYFLRYFIDLFKGYAWNLYNSAVKDLILKMLEKDHTKRLSASEAKNHSWIV